MNLWLFYLAGLVAVKSAVVRKRPASLKLNLLGSISSRSYRPRSEGYISHWPNLVKCKSQPGWTGLDGVKGLWRTDKIWHFERSGGPLVNMWSMETPTYWRCQWDDHLGQQQLWSGANLSLRQAMCAMNGRAWDGELHKPFGTQIMSKSQMQYTEFLDWIYSVGVWFCFI